MTRQGREYVAAINQRGEPLESIEQDATAYVEAERFRARHPDAYAKWKQAHAYLAADPIEHATRIGHDCREALRDFAQSLSAAHGIEPSKGTFDTIDAVIDSRRDELGKGTSAMLDALGAM